MADLYHPGSRFPSSYLFESDFTLVQPLGPSRSLRCAPHGDIRFGIFDFNQRFSQKTREPPPFRQRQPGHQLLGNLVPLRQSGDDDFPSLGGQFDENAPTVVRILAPPDKSGFFKLIQTIRHRTGRTDQRCRKATGRNTSFGRPQQSRQETGLRTLEADGTECRTDALIQERAISEKAADDFERVFSRSRQIRLLSNSIDVIFTHSHRKSEHVRNVLPRLSGD